MKTLKKSMQGPEVRTLQRALNLYFPKRIPLNITGNFGDVTEQYVRDFQQRKRRTNNKIKVSGVVDQETWDELLTVSTLSFRAVITAVGDDLRRQYFEANSPQQGRPVRLLDEQLRLRYFGPNSPKDSPLPGGVDEHETFRWRVPSRRGLGECREGAEPPSPHWLADHGPAAADTDRLLNPRWHLDNWQFAGGTLTTLPAKIFLGPGKGDTAPGFTSLAVSGALTWKGTYDDDDSFHWEQAVNGQFSQNDPPSDSRYSLQATYSLTAADLQSLGRLHLLDRLHVNSFAQAGPQLNTEKFSPQLGASVGLQPSFDIIENKWMIMVQGSAAVQVDLLTWQVTAGLQLLIGTNWQFDVF
jgi:peptidoglycan hydrolase-like protein with peptidoglycan-binding domain